MPPLQAAGRLPLIGFYALYFGVVGILLPFLPAYLKSLALSVTQVGLLLSLSPLVALVGPHFWGHLADRTGRPHRAVAAGLELLAALLVLRISPEKPGRPA